MHKLPNEQITHLKAKSFALINDGEAYEPYQDFFRYTQLTKHENLSEGITFNRENGEFYASLAIQSDWSSGCKEYGTSDNFETLAKAFDWLETAKVEFDAEIKAVTKTDRMDNQAPASNWK
jgi:hypothetical protein